MESISVTTYRGFSTVNGETTLAQDMADIKNGKYARLIIKIASLVIQGKTEEANNVKKQLPFRTLTARKKVGIRHYPLQSGYHPRPRRTGRRSSGSHTEPDQQRPEHLRQLPVSQKAWLQNFRVQADRICMPATRRAAARRNRLRVSGRGTLETVQRRQTILRGIAWNGDRRQRQGHIERLFHLLRPGSLSEHDIAATNRTIGSPHHRSRKRSEKTAGKKTCRHRGVSPHRSFSPARSRALGETAILQSGDRRKTQHEIQKGKP